MLLQMLNWWYLIISIHPLIIIIRKATPITNNFLSNHGMRQLKPKMKNINSFVSDYISFF